ncbi:MAG: hypothetical protein JXB13_20670, partial [Phycisphaerae bacterium]|nr:hypothetical protein [Phycisphaerae bacterium]
MKRRRWGGFAPAWICMVGLTGCFEASLATSTGPRAKGDWSVAGTQMVHVGEEVGFDFVIFKPFTHYPLDPEGIATYAVLDVGEASVFAEAGHRGHFEFTHHFQTEPAGAALQARATAYRAIGGRDRGRVQTSWSDFAANEPDRRVASDTVRLRFYQSVIELTVPVAAEPLDFSAARLEIRKSDGTATSVYQDRASRRGFRVSGPEKQV